MKKLAESLLTCKDGINARLKNCYYNDEHQVIRVIQDFLPYAKVSLESKDPFIINIDMLDFEIKYLVDVSNKQIKNMTAVV